LKSIDVSLKKYLESDKSVDEFLDEEIVSGDINPRPEGNQGNPIDEVEGQFDTVDDKVE